MIDFMTAVGEALKLRAGAGDLLAAVTAARIYQVEPDRDCALPSIVVIPAGASGFIGEKKFRTAKCTAEINGHIALEGSRMREAFAEAAALGDRIMRVLLENRILATGSFTGGLLSQGERVAIEKAEYYSDILESAAGSGRQTFAVKVTCSAEVRWFNHAVAGALPPT